MLRLAGRRSRASLSSLSASFVNSGALSTKPMHPRISAVSYFSEPSHIGCRKLFSAVSARRGSASCANLLSSSRRAERGGYVLVRDLKPGTRLIREWRGRTYQVLVVDDGFSWRGTRYRSLSALARKITGTPWSGPLFFGLKPNRSAIRRSSQPAYPAGEPMESGNAAG
jgi:hypothetical protein